MKIKTKLIIGTILAALVFPGLVSAGTITAADYIYGVNRDTRKITYTVSFGTSTTIPNTALDSITRSSGSVQETIAGWWLFRVDIIPGSTGPTDDSDLYLWSVEDQIDVLENAGNGEVDNATNRTVYPVASTQPLTGAEIFDIDGNAVANATCTIVFTLHK